MITTVFFDAVGTLFFWSHGVWTLFPEVFDALQQLKAAGYKIGIISNFDERLPEVLKSLKISDFIDTVIWPSQAGVGKPAPKIFLTALAAAKAQANQAAHVGNDLEADVHGALAVGMMGIFLDRGKSAPRGTGVKIIHDLSELQKIISRPS